MLAGLSGLNIFRTPPVFWAAAVLAMVNASRPAATAAPRRRVRVISASQPDRPRDWSRLPPASPFPASPRVCPVSLPGGTVAWRNTVANAPRSPTRRSRSAPRTDDQEGWALALIGESRLRGDLLRARAPLLDMGQGEAEPQQHVEIGRDGAVLFDDAFRQPIR